MRKQKFLAPTGEELSVDKQGFVLWSHANRISPISETRFSVSFGKARTRIIDRHTELVVSCDDMPVFMGAIQSLLNANVPQAESVAAHMGNTTVDIGGLRIYFSRNIPDRSWVANLSLAGGKVFAYIHFSDIEAKEMLCSNYVAPPTVM